MRLIPEEQTCDNIIIHIEESEAGLTVKQFLRKQWQGSGRLLTRLKKEEGVQLNGRWVPFHHIMATGDILQLMMEEEACNFIPQFLPFEVLYEDTDVMVVNKPPYMVTHPTINQRDGTLANGIMYYMIDKGESYKVRFVNRLDMDTSGVMIIAKNAFSHHSLMLQMKDDQTIKTYRVLVWGQLSQDKGTIDAPIYRQESLPENEPPRRIVDARGKRALSHFQVEERYASATLVKVTIETGRTHQIRVHMKYIGHPLAGDPKYGPKKTIDFNGQVLHAGTIGFKHPKTGEYLEFTQPLTEDFKNLIEKMQNEKR